MTFDPHRYQSALATRWLGRKMAHHPILDSTNAALKDWARREPVPVGQVVLADAQRAGYGQHGRTWSSDHAGIYVSAWLPSSAARVPLTLAAGVAAAEALRALVECEEIGLKWVNDLVARGCKLGGILAEGLAGGVVLGLGINLTTPDRPEAIGLDRLGAVATREEILAAIFNRLEPWLEGDGTGVAARWSALSVTLGRQVRIEHPQATLTGLAEAITERGALVLRLADGSRTEVHAGTVRLIDGRYC